MRERFGKMALERRDGVTLLPGETDNISHVNTDPPAVTIQIEDPSHANEQLDKKGGLPNGHTISGNGTIGHSTGEDNPSFSPEGEAEAIPRDTDSTMYSNGSVVQRGSGSGGSSESRPNGCHHQCSTMEVNHNVVVTDSEEKRKEAEILAEKAREETSEDRMVSLVLKLVVCLLCGMVMGLALEKGRVFEPRSIRCQFTYQIWIMMKMFLSALATGLLCLATLSVLPFTKRAFEEARIEYVSCISSKGILMASIGGMLLGAGMALAGACPGMVLAQVGAWAGQGSGLVTFVGALVGSFGYAVCHPFIDRSLGRSTPYKRHLADDWVSHVPFALLALVLAAVTAGIVVAIEFWRPWRTEILTSPAQNFEPTWFMTEYAWPPYIAGILIGMLQIPLVLLIRDTLGGSSSYCTISSQILITRRMEEAVPYLAKFKRGLSSWWQVFFVTGVILGAMSSSLLSHTIAKVDGVGWGVSFFGGFVMLFGARFAGGCTSGHGISGVGVLALLSFIAVAAMFAGGTVIGLIGWGMGKAEVIDPFCPL